MLVDNARVLHDGDPDRARVRDKVRACSMMATLIGPGLGIRLILALFLALTPDPN